MVIKQAFAVLVVMVSIVGSAFGLGLGDITVKSNLNDPLEAEIELLQLQGLTAGEVLPTLASNDDFRRAGIERSFFLANIQFRVKENESGNLVVTLATKQAVREPFLNFLVEINWPGGRLLKEYTILLDPPVFDTGLAVDALVVEPSSTLTSATDLVTTTIVDSSESTTVVNTSPSFEPRVDEIGDGQYRVKRNDTLWEISLKVPDRNGYSPQQVMLAIQDLNPKAFLNNNINQVKAGSVLNLPDSAQIATRSLEEAIAEVQGQNKGSAPKLRAPVTSTSEVQLSATESTSSAMPSETANNNPDGYLELTADSDQTTTTASGEAAAIIDQLQNQLASAEELNDQFERERDDLESRVKDLQEQIDIMEKLLEIQNSDLAQAQNALTDTAGEDSTSTPQPAEPVSQPVTPVAVQPAAEPAKPVTPPAPVPAPELSILDKIMSYVSKASDWVLGSTTNMAIVGAALLLIILLPLYIRSKRSGEEQTLDEMNIDEQPGFDASESFTADIDDDLLVEVEEDFDEEPSEESETIDAVVEAEMYMAYQKYDQAEEKLKEALADHPNRPDLALKLLEVYSETGDTKAFNELEGRLSFNAEDQKSVEELRSKLPMGEMESDIDASDNYLDGDLDLDVNLDSPVESSSEMDLGSDLDFSLDLGGTEEESSSSDLDDEMNFDLDLDSGLSSEPSDDHKVEDPMSLDLSASLDPMVEDDEEDSDLDFSLDLDSLDSPSVEEVKDKDDFSVEEKSIDLNLDDSLGDLDSLESESDGLDFSLDLESEGEIDSETDTLSMDTDFDQPETLTLDDSLDLDLGETSGELDEESFDLELGSDVEGLDLDLDSATLEDDLDDPLKQLADSLESDAELEEDEFDFLSGSDEASTKLDLARAYIEMDDKEGAKDILEEVVAEGSDEQKAQAKDLISQL